MLLGSPGLFCMDQSLLLPRQAQWRLLFGLSCWRCWAAIYMHGKGATIDFICVISTVCSVCLNLSEVLMLLFACCSERVRDVLVAMWDRKTMGDMPKTAESLFAAATAQRAAAAAAMRAGATAPKAAAAAAAEPSVQQQPLLLQQQSQQQQRSKSRRHSRPQSNRVSSDHDDSDFEHTGATSDSSFGLSDLENERGVNIRKRGRPPAKRPRPPISSDAKKLQPLERPASSSSSSITAALQMAAAQQQKACG